MLFNSLIFIFLFLPVSLIGYYFLCTRRLVRWRFAFLSLMSMVFYAYASWTFAALLALSTAFNLLAAKVIENRRDAGAQRAMRWVLRAALVGNLLFLCYFKYLGFFIDLFDTAFGTRWLVPDIALPIGISFYTFLFMGTLIDVSRGEVSHARAGAFVSFSLFFPHLLAGPLVHYEELVPQIERRPFLSRMPAHFLVGFAIFAIGLFKKTVLADTIALYVKPVYAASEAGNHLEPSLCWLAALGFTLQLYFDFSGYSDMAIGLARMFGYKLPLNFHSPLRSPNIVEYWRRWHMTLQRFIVAYLFPALAVPLTRWALGRRLGKWPDFFATVAAPTMITFVVVGFWHGASWNFIVFGAMHGCYLAICQAWRKIRLNKHWRKKKVGTAERLAAHALLLLSVACANVVFRAPTLHGAWKLLGGMAGSPGVTLDPGYAVLGQAMNAALVAFGFAFVFLLPNTQQIMRRYGPALDWDKWRHQAPPVVSLTYRLNLAWAVSTGTVFLLGVAFIMRGQAEFIYFRF